MTSTLLKLSKTYVMFKVKVFDEIFEGKITIFKSLAMSKIVHLVMTTKVPNTVSEELKQIQKNFLRNKKKVKIKQSNLRND